MADTITAYNPNPIQSAFDWFGNTFGNSGNGVGQNTAPSNQGSIPGTTYSSGGQNQSYMPNASTAYGTASYQGTNTTPVQSYLGNNTLGAKTSNTGGSGGMASLPPPPTGNTPSAPDYSQIDQLYGDVTNSINDWAGSLPSLDTITNSFVQPYEANRSGLEGAKTQGLNLNQQQRGEAQGSAQNALSEATRLYNEMKQGGVQRFGQSNSAGQFYNDYLGKSLMQNQGNIQNTLGSNIRSLDTAKQDIYTKYQTGVQQLDSQIAQAKTQAQLAFQNQLAQVNQAKVGAAQDKSAQKLSALQNYRQTLAQLDAQATAFKQNLYAQAMSGLQGVQQYVAQLQAQSGTPVNLQNMMSPYMPAIGGSTAGQQTTPFITGNAGKKEQR